MRLKRLHILAQLTLALFFATPSAFAGLISEVNVVYADLGKSKNSYIEASLRGAISSKSPECWNKGEGFIYMKKRPPGITNDLLYDAIVQGKKDRQRLLEKLLLSYKDDDASGFDGAVIYVDSPSKRFISFNARKRTIKSQEISDISNAKDIELSFCSVKPEIVRLP